MMIKKTNDVSLKEALQAYVDSSKRLKEKLFQAKAKMTWEESMGPTIMRYTTEFRIRRRKVYIEISSAALRQELGYGKEKILKILNEALGEEYLEGVVIR